MISTITPKELGQRISAMRKTKSFSQEELSNMVNISRSSLAQIELGNRSISILEMQKLAEALAFSLDDVMSQHFKINQLDELEDEDVSIKNELRISVPKLQVRKLKNVLLYLLERCAGKPNVGETVLYKLLYFSDFNYYELYEEHLTGVQYRKLPYGPVPYKIDSILSQMIANNQLQMVKIDYHGYTQTRYLPLEKADLTSLKASETEVIDKVLDQMCDWSAQMISDYAHGDLPWIVTENGKPISYNLAFYREPPYSVRVYDNELND